jgi:hypothetical protein
VRSTGPLNISLKRFQYVRGNSGDLSSVTANLAVDSSVEKLHCTSLLNLTASGKNENTLLSITPSLIQEKSTKINGLKKKAWCERVSTETRLLGTTEGTSTTKKERKKLA